MSIVKKTEAYSALVGNRNDCVVRALSIAANKPYEECDALFTKFGRKRGRRTDHHISTSVHAYLKSKTVIDEDSPHPTLTQFIKNHPKGRFVLTRRGHAFALVDGVVHDWSRSPTGPRSRIVKAWAVKK